MSGRQRSKVTKKTASSTASSEVLTPSSVSEIAEEEVTMEQSSTGRLSGSRTRSISPLSISRIEEKEEIAHLNDRLATYIDYVHNIEQKNERLSRRVTSTTENLQVDITGIRQQFEGELSSLRASLDEMSAARVKADLAKKRAEDEANEALRAKRDAEAKLAQVTKALDKEMLQRANLESRIQSIEEQANFQRRLHEEEVTQLKKTTILEVEEQVKTASKDEYDSRLAEELRSLREESLVELQTYRDQMEADFDARLQALQAARATQLEEISTLRQEVSRYRQQSDSSESELNTLRSRCQRLENDLKQQRETYESELQRQRDIESDLRSQLESQLRDFADLMAVKVALDQEILAYRKLLEHEESRLNITPITRETSFSSIGRGTSSKRRRVDLDDTDSGSRKDSYVKRSRSSGNVAFEEVDADKGSFVRLSNSSSDEVALAGCVLKWSADGKEISYKFGKNATVPPTSSVTVWSSNSKDAVSDAPNNLVMKGQSFQPASLVDVSLTDADGKEMAGSTIQREVSVLRRSAVTGRLTARHLVAPGKKEDEKCSLM